MKKLATIILLTLCGLGLLSSCSATANSQRTNLVNGIVTVKAGGYYQSGFTLNRNASIEGTIRASGGAGNDIEVYIFDEIGLTNWSNGHQTDTYYNSGRITAANLNVSLSPGKYYLVFSNTFSLISEKNVTANVEIAG